MICIDMQNSDENTQQVIHNDMLKVTTKRKTVTSRYEDFNCDTITIY